MAKITYLLGAGASAAALPTVAEFEKNLGKLITFIDEFRRFLDLDEKKLPDNKQDVLDVLDKVEYDLNNLLRGCVEFRSIDTYISQLFLTAKTKEHKEAYRIAKCSIVLFFELYRFFKERLDNHNKIDEAFRREKRYDAFFATILRKDENDDLIIPNHINVLSWNYDYEFERAYMKYATKLSNIDDACKELGVIHKSGKDKRINADGFGITKINGTVGFFHNNELKLGLGQCNITFNQRKSATGFHSGDIRLIYPLIKNYYDFTYLKADEYEPAISFAWEGGKALENIREEIAASLQNTTRLIVIGYSFPYFNRDIDAHIMESLNNVEHLKVYVQDREERANHLIDSIKDLRRFWSQSAQYETAFIPKTDLDQFYMSF